MLIGVIERKLQEYQQNIEFLFACIERSHYCIEMAGYLENIYDLISSYSYFLGRFIEEGEIALYHKYREKRDYYLIDYEIARDMLENGGKKK